MTNGLNYKDYVGSVQFSAEDEVFYGRILGISDRITFEGDSVASLQKDFHDAVDDYIATCEEIGKEPQKPYKGSFNVRIRPELHRNAAMFAASHNQTLNAFVEKAIENTLNQH